MRFIGSVLGVLALLLGLAGPGLAADLEVSIVGLKDGVVRPHPQLGPVVIVSAPTDGVRVVIDRLWPRGLSKRVARLDEWRRDLALSDALLHKWYGHDPAKWPEFRRRYTAELKGKTAEPQKLARRARQEKVTLVFAASDVEHSNAFVLKSVLERLDE